MVEQGTDGGMGHRESGKGLAAGWATAAEKPGIAAGRDPVGSRPVLRAPRIAISSPVS